MAAPESHKLDTTRAERNFLNMKDLLEFASSALGWAKMTFTT
jgi:hypothetical protein